MNTRIYTNDYHSLAEAYSTVNKQKQMTTISEDMRDVVKRHLTLDKQYRVQWSAIAGTRQAKKTRGGNFEDLWVFVK